MNIREGQTVCLKIGGPPMVVIFGPTEQDRVECLWFDPDGRTQKEFIPASLLTVIVPDDEP